MSRRKSRIVMNTKYFVYLILVFILLIVIGRPDYIGRKNRANSSQIREGMTKNEVIQIMGEPKSKGIPFASINEADYTYQYQAPFGSSDGIYISFDKEGKVVHIANE
jgi:hypothetical protein